MTDSLRADAQGVLLAAYGGELSKQEQGFTEEQVMFWLVQDRDRLMERDLEKDGERFQPDDAYFSVYERHPVLWDAVKNVAYLDVPSDPPMVMYNRGIRIEPVTGGGSMFVGIPSNFCQANPDLSWLEGNWGWEYRSGRVVFPNMRQADMPGNVTLYIIETRVADPDKPLRLPSRHRAECRDRVLELMGIGVQDTRTDGKDKRTGGGER